MTVLTLVAAALVAHSVRNAPTPFPPVQQLDGAPAKIAGSAAPTILLFWRADCAPCLLELADLKALKAAGRGARVIPVGLQSAATLRAALARVGLSPSDTLRTTEDGATLLIQFGGAPPRLPLAVAFRPGGAFCGRHTGLLGRDQVRAWAAVCGGAHVSR